MKIAGIDFPKELLSAIRAGRLVIFAGSGVSRERPACLPDFTGLAKSVARGTGEPLNTSEPPDQFLGRLQDRGQNVGERAADEILKDDPQPTVLHFDLLRLYSEPRVVRLVTTNFDRLFEKADNEPGGPGTEVFTAPALPLGNCFNGIVHIHGSVDRPSDMVLTDKDFGRAYITEGWARRFLVDLFSSYTVLFVGYSHKDVVMSYLTRAMPPETTSRFALADREDRERWRNLGVTPILFAKQSDKDYQALNDGVRGLANYARRGTVAWQREIREIARKLPPLDEEAIDLLNDSLSDPVRTRFFTSAASDPQWITWLEKHNHLSELFKSGERGSLTESDRCLAWWLAESFISENSEALLLLVARKGMLLHPDFRTALGSAIASKAGASLEVDTLGHWVSILLATAPRGLRDRILPGLGKPCIEAGLVDGLVDIFDAMAATHLEVKPSLSLPEYKPALRFIAESSPVYPYQDLNRLWESGLKPNLEQVAEPVLARLVEIMLQQHRTLCSWQAAARDPSSGRYAIELSPHNRRAASIDKVIDGARDCLACLTKKSPPTCRHLVRPPDKGRCSDSS